MPVKRIHSGARVLAVLEAVAAHQPIGVRALARLLNEDKSAVQRALLTLADKGWIRTTSEPPVRWEVTGHILAVAHAAHGSDDLRRRARPMLESLRDRIGETVLLVVPDVGNFVIADVIESRQALRMAPNVGTLVSAVNTATGRAILPFLAPERQTALLGVPPDRQLLESFEATRQRGYAISEGEVDAAVTNLAAAILEFNGSPVGAVVACGPRERLKSSLFATVGPLVAQTAKDLSRGAPQPGLADTVRGDVAGGALQRP